MLTGLRKMLETEDPGPTKSKYALFWWLILHGMVLVVALCAFIPFIVGFLYGGNWATAPSVFFLASFSLALMLPNPEPLPPIEGQGKARQFRLPHWSLVS
jgi:hypothetical protein